jgi:transposase, IS6 family
VYRWVQTFTPGFIDSARPARRATGDRWLVDETYVKVASNRVEADHGRLKARPRPMRGLKSIRSLRTVAAGHAFVQNLRRGHYEITVDGPVHDRARVAFTELACCL